MSLPRLTFHALIAIAAPNGYQPSLISLSLRSAYEGGRNMRAWVLHSSEPDTAPWDDQRPMATTPSRTVDQEGSLDHNLPANLAECPGHDLLGTLSDKWVTLVISALADGPLRHAELARIVAGASQKMLTQTLRKLERDGLLDRTVTPSVPARVDYELTALGHSLLPVQRAIKAWAEAHIDSVNGARQRYDATH